MEVWKDIPGYEGFYQASSFGRIRSVDRTIQCADSIRTYKGRILKPDKKKNGYLEVALNKQGNRKQHLVHRLVAITFIDNPKGLLVVNHKDEDKENNSIGNLEWCSQSYNNNYGEGHQNRRINSPIGVIKKLAKPVVQYSLDGDFIAEYYSAMEAGRQTGVSQGGISECCNGKQKTAYGYIWRYKEVT